MAEEKKEPWLNWLALTTVILAVCATLSTFKGGGFSTRSVLSQTQASDQWAYYQAKSIKGYLYELQKGEFELKLKTEGATLTPAVRAEYQNLVADYGAKISKYEKEKTEIMAEAKRFEEVRDNAQSHSKTFGIAVIYLQLAVLLSSVAALLKKKPVWVAGLCLGTLGVGYFISGLV